MYLDKQTFTQVIDSTPLISIDLVVENSHGQILLGLRNNRPAQGYWFVPGGRIRKNESLDSAFERLCNEELGLGITRSQAQCLGPFEHFYDDCVFGDEVSTHYVVIEYRVVADILLDTLPEMQHNQYRWFNKADMLGDDTVHVHSKWYVQSPTISD